MKRLIVLIAIILLAVTGCQQGDSRLETDIETFIDETDAIVNTTEEEPITEEPTTEEEPETKESIADESAAQEMVEPEEPDLVFTYELEQERDYFIMNHLWAGEDYNYELTDMTITQTEDGYILTGEKSHSGGIILTWKQKALLDSGAIMNVTYDGEVVEQFTSLRSMESRWDNKWKMVPCIWYETPTMSRGVAEAKCLLSPESDEWARYIAGIDLSEPPYDGVGYVLQSPDGRERTTHIVLDEHAQVLIPGDTPIDSIEQMTMAEYYERWISKMGDVVYFPVKYEVYEEEGKVVKIIEKSTEAHDKDEYLRRYGQSE